MKIPIIIILLLSTAVSSCQVPWTKASDWTIYGYQGNGLFEIRLDSLKKMDTLLLDQDTMISYLSSATVLHPRGPVAWMGGYISTCNLDGAVRKVELSNYGGFFYDEKTKAYYQIAPNKTELWLSYLQQSFLILAHKRRSSN